MHASYLLHHPVLVGLLQRDLALPGQLGHLCVAFSIIESNHEGGTWVQTIQICRSTLSHPQVGGSRALLHSINPQHPHHSRQPHPALQLTLLDGPVLGQILVDDAGHSCPAVMWSCRTCVGGGSVSRSWVALLGLLGVAKRRGRKATKEGKKAMRARVVVSSCFVEESCS